MKVEELQASGVASQEQATAVSMELAASRDANAALQSTLEAERRMHQRKVTALLPSNLTSSRGGVFRHR